MKSVQKRQRTLDGDSNLGGETRKCRKSSDDTNNLRLVLKDFIESNTSFRAVERPTKRQLLQRAKLPTPTRKTLAKELTKSAAIERTKLFREVRNADCLVLCIDLWTNNSREDFLSVLAFFIDPGKFIFLDSSLFSCIRIIKEVFPSPQFFSSMQHGGTGVPLSDLRTFVTDILEKTYRWH
jgi:hypothetical protein